MEKDERPELSDLEIKDYQQTDNQYIQIWDKKLSENRIIEHMKCYLLTGAS